MRLLAFFACVASALAQRPEAVQQARPEAVQQARTEAVQKLQKPTPEAVQRKLDLIQSGRAPSGGIYLFTSAELNAWARWKVPQVVPDGVRAPRLELTSGGAKAFALVDFVRTRQGQGETTNWLIAKLIEGEKPVTVSARIDSGRGRAIVHLTAVEIGGVAVTGAPLDFLIETFFRPLFPDAKIGQWFELPGNLDRLEILPSSVRAIIRQIRHQ